MASIFSCFNHGENLPVLSGTDLACAWTKIKADVLKVYKAMPLDEHPCFLERRCESTKKKQFQKTQNAKAVASTTPSKQKVPALSNSNILNSPVKAKDKKCSKDPPQVSTRTDCNENRVSSDSDQNKRKNDNDSSFILTAVKKFRAMPEFSHEKLMRMQERSSVLTDSGLLKEKAGRHDLFQFQDYSNKVSEHEKKIYEAIFNHQNSNLIDMVDCFQVKPLLNCCQNLLKKLSKDPVMVCVNTRNQFADWLTERKCRVTGTTCYGLYTYSQRDKLPAQWKNKVQDFVTPKEFSTEATRHGLKHEAPARELYKQQHPQYEVIEAGLITCKRVPWLSFSPDGIVVSSGKPVKLLEIKCMLDGKTKGIDDVVQKQISSPHGCLTRDDHVVSLKNNNRYYGQVQLGMLLLNVDSCDFVLYSSFEKKIFIVNVVKDKLFLSRLLRQLKSVYYFTILPQMCLMESDKSTSLHANEKHLHYVSDIPRQSAESKKIVKARTKNKSPKVSQSSVSSKLGQLRS